jgi:ParB family transcriptional regulator, chromosome partitioning protein
LIQSVHLIPTTEIDELALARDRTVIDPDALLELRVSIAASGLRSPIEVFELPAQHTACRYGLISGFRRLAAVRALHGLTGFQDYFTIPAFIRTPSGAAAAFAAMIEENEVRQDLSPWERGRAAVTARDLGLFGTIEEAVDRLHPGASAAKRSRLRTLARVAAQLDGELADPETLSQKQVLRLATALREGFGAEIRAALDAELLSDPDSQWSAILPIVEEAERVGGEDASRSRRPRIRTPAMPRPGLTIRRERTRSGFALHFSGPDATPPLLDLVFEEIERLLAPE